MFPSEADISFCKIDFTLSFQVTTDRSSSVLGGLGAKSAQRDRSTLMLEQFAASFHSICGPTCATFLSLQPDRITSEAFLFI